LAGRRRIRISVIDGLVGTGLARPCRGIPAGTGGLLDLGIIAVGGQHVIVHTLLVAHHHHPA
jgi:hypothetical protein